MAPKWSWVGKYFFVILIALILGMAIGNLALFRLATLGTPRFTAAVLTKFIAYAGALGLLWALGFRVSHQLRSTGGSAASFGTPVLALTTLIVVPTAYVVLLQLIRPFLARDLKPFIEWTFIIATIATAIWFVAALFIHSDVIIEAMGRSATAGRKVSTTQSPARLQS